MNSLIDSLGQHSTEILFALCSAVVVLGALLIRVQLRLRGIVRRWSALLSGTGTENLELLLHDHLRERVRLESDLAEARRRLDQLEEKVASAKRHLGVVRYDAFDDVGGAQSFALAIFDDRGDGAILNGLVGRSDCRVYCKPLQSGRSERNLSQEEQRAMEAAIDTSPQAMVSQLP
jgi:hypothetical protein